MLRMFSFFLLFGVQQVHAQYPSFIGGASAGLNFAELEGEGATDYTGLNAGLWSSVRFHRHWQAGLGLQYSRNGEFILPDYYPDLDYGVIRLDHLEVPFQLELLMFCKGNPKARKTPASAQASGLDRHCYLSFQWGAAYTVLFRHYAEDALETDVSDQVRYTDRDAWVLQSGFTVWAWPRVGFRVKGGLPPWTPELGPTLSAQLLLDLGTF
jgi:hypothetical protein